MQLPLGYPWQPEAGVKEALRISQNLPESPNLIANSFKPFHLGALNHPQEGRLKILCYIIPFQHFFRHLSCICFHSATRLQACGGKKPTMSASWSRVPCLSGSLLYPQDQCLAQNRSSSIICWLNIPRAVNAPPIVGPIVGPKHSSI